MQQLCRLTKKVYGNTYVALILPCNLVINSREQTRKLTFFSYTFGLRCDDDDQHQFKYPSISITMTGANIIQIQNQEYVCVFSKSEGENTYS